MVVKPCGSLFLKLFFRYQNVQSTQDKKEKQGNCGLISITKRGKTKKMSVKWMKKNDIRFFIVNFAAYYALMRNGDRHRTDGTPPYRPGKRLNRMRE